MKNNMDAQGVQTGEDTPGLLAVSLAGEIPEVEKAVSVFPPAGHTFKGILSIGDNQIKARSKFADKDFFHIFSYPLIYGSRENVLLDKYNVVISKKLATDLFYSSENAIGKALEWKGERNEGQFLVSGVFEDPPASASVQFDIVFSYALLIEDISPNILKWGNSGPSTYVVLKEGASVAAFNAKIGDFVKSKYEESTLTLFARKYSDRYLYSDYENGALAGGRITYVRLFSLTAVFILIIACFNFMNLYTAKATGKIKEVGIKKAIGASRKILVFQYMGESIIMSFLSLILAIILVALFLPQFNQITGKELTLNLGNSLIWTGLGLTLMTGIIAGVYPALYLSSFNPIAVLKGKFGMPVGEVMARKGLVVSQFVLCIVLVIAVVVVSEQIHFVQTKNLGFSRDQVVRFTAEGKIAEKPDTFLSELKKISGVVNASHMDGDLVGLHNGTTGIGWEGQHPDQIVDFEFLGIGHDMIPTLGIRIIEGRSFDRGFGSEETKLIFNEAAIERMGITDPVGKIVSLWGEEQQIIGVVKNFHFESLYENVNPFFFRLSPKAGNILVKIEAGKEQETLARIEKFYQEYNMGLPFEYMFLDEDFQMLYASETRVAVLSRYFAALTILISCLGLFGLAVFSAERRTKEIGIRKVMGASEWGIIKLLSSDFAKMVCAAIVLALPFSYYVAHSWLESFAYKIDLEWWYFIGAGLLTMGIALLTVGLQSVKAAWMNPVASLRSE
jgi:ABC-type antimicrobial peptide transport system permease subunit